jgi:hypothetical protein
MYTQQAQRLQVAWGNQVTDGPGGYWHVGILSRRLSVTAVDFRLLGRVESGEGLFAVEPPTPAHFDWAEDATMYQSLDSPAAATQVAGQFVGGRHTNGDGAQNAGGRFKIHVR